MKNFILLLALVSFLSPAYANSPITIRENLAWEATPTTFPMEGQMVELWKFAGAIVSDEHPSLPYFLHRFPVEGKGSLKVEILSSRFEAFDKAPSPDDVILEEALVFQTSVVKQRSQYYGKINFVPIIKNGNNFERLVEFNIRVSLIPDNTVTLRGPENTDNSVLSDGQIYKFAVTEDGIHQLTYSFLKDELNIDIDNIDPRSIKLYGNGGGLLPVYTDMERIDDLAENPIQIVGEDDGSFDSGDYILFYGQGPDKWSYNKNTQGFDFQKNIYDTKNYYFLKISSGNGARIADQNTVSSTGYNSNSFDDFARFENDKANLLHDWTKTSGSGQNWYGDHFKVARSYDYPKLFRFSNLIINTPVKVTARMALRADTGSSFNLQVNGKTLTSSSASRVSQLSGPQDNIIDYAKPALLDGTAQLNSGEMDFTVNYPRPASNDASEGWLDYIQVQVRRNLSMDGNQMDFRDINSFTESGASFVLQNANSNIKVWDISDPIQPKNQTFSLNGSQLSFGVNTDTISLKTFIAFSGQGYLIPEAIGPIDNQNVHGIDEVDMVIVYPEAFEAEATQLAQHRTDYSNLSVALVRIDHIMNEFASGKQDPTAIRDFAKMVYDRTDRFRYLLLFGDGSFDYRDVYGLGGNFVTVYERESFNPIFAFPADDYFGILEAVEHGTDPLNGDLNVAVGRLPVKTPQEAANAVSKIRNYESNPVTMGGWRNQLVFVGDDEDGFIHTRDANAIADLINENYPSFNIDKIFLDAYPQVSTPGGDRFPAVTEALNKSIFKGTLAVTYLGHGGSKGWAQERILNITDILNWENFDRQPLFITATCSFTGYDDAAFTTAGEEVFLNPKGGAIGLMTTTRAVYASQNAELTEAALLKLFERPENRLQTIGEVMQRAKNSFSGTGIITNSRKFTLIGDPALVLAIPEYNVGTTKIDTHDVSDGEVDTLRALQKVTIEGVILDNNGQVYNNFNGVIFPTIFDKKIVVSTLGQDEGSPVRDFQLQKNIIFKGRATVQNGTFRFTFVVPKDINYEYGPGKISYYAKDEDQKIDAAGNYDRIIIGGTDPNAFADDLGPKVDVFMNTVDFVFGGITDENPTLLVKLEDDNGINVVGNSIGHDLEGTLDDNTQNTYLLNEFYESELDDYTKGTVQFPLSKLAEGRHTIRVKAWDVANNSAEGYTEFVVASSSEVALEHVLNYPNPFTDQTCFQFDHNLTNQELEVLVHIYTVSGRLVKTIEQFIFSDGAIRQDNCIPWNGKDDFGDQLARGVYLYKVKVRAVNTGDSTISGESDFEKLVILK